MTKLDAVLLVIYNLEIKKPNLSVTILTQSLKSESFTEQLIKSVSIMEKKYGRYIVCVCDFES